MGSGKGRLQIFADSNVFLEVVLVCEAVYEGVDFFVERALVFEMLEDGFLA